MSKGKTIAIGIGLATGALLVTWLLTGSRKEKTKQFIAKRATGIKPLSTEKAKKRVYEDSNSYYI